MTSGDADASNAFDPAVEWDGFPINTLDGLGGYPDEVVDPPPGACDEPVTATIPQIQGTGTASPLAGQTVTTRGVVTADTQGGSGLNGFFLQDAAGDDDPATSDGVFVFVPSANPLASVDVAVGDEVAVIGRATEFNTLTEIDFVTAIEVCGQAAVPAATAYSLPEPSNGDLERVEGMLVTIPQTLTVQQNFFLGRFGQLTLGFGRPAVHADQHPSGRLAARRSTLADANQRALLVLDDGRSSQNPNPIPYIGEDQTNRAGDTVSGLVGVLDHGQISSDSAIRDYRLHPTTPPSFDRINDAHGGARGRRRQPHGRELQRAELLHDVRRAGPRGEQPGGVRPAAGEDLLRDGRHGRGRARPDRDREPARHRRGNEPRRRPQRLCR